MRSQKLEPTIFLYNLIFLTLTLSLGPCLYAVLCKLAPSRSVSVVTPPTVQS